MIPSTGRGGPRIGRESQASARWGHRAGGLLVAALLCAVSGCTVLNRYIPIQSAPPEVSSAGFRLPANGRITSTFGMRALLGTTRMHKGIDFEGEYLIGPVFAAADGVVTLSQTSETYGEWIEIKHPNGYSTRYAHMVWRHVSAGSEVKQGDVIGRFGSTGRSTGTHLHFEILRGGAQIDPLPLMPRAQVVGNTGRAKADAAAAPPPSGAPSSPSAGAKGGAKPAAPAKAPAKKGKKGGAPPTAQPAEPAPPPAAVAPPEPAPPAAEPAAEEGMD
ncbi:MAG: M23 family metallopeptidase [bacterium]